MKSNESVNIVIKYIEEHLEEALTTTQLSEIAGYSEYHFIRMFKAQMNTTIMDYVIKRRLIKASEDILAGEKIIDAAFKYGWQSSSGFTKAFVREFDFAPSLLKAMKISMDILGGSGMSHVFLSETKVGQTKVELYELLKCKLKENGLIIEQEKLDKTYSLASKAYENVNRYSGEEYITHLLNVAIILTELGVEENIVLAGMFCDVAKKGVWSMEVIKEAIDADVYEIIERTQNIDTELCKAKDDVIMIKLAERLHNMRTIEFMEDSRKAQKAKETIEIYMPLARRLNNQKLIDELNDLGIRYLR